jgi:hypothetical protein
MDDLVATVQVLIETLNLQEKLFEADISSRQKVREIRLNM